MSPESLIIFRLGSIGDTVVALPCFRAIARTFPHHHRVLLTNGLASPRASSVESVLSGTGLIHEVVYYPVGGAAGRKFAALFLALRRRRVRTLVYLQPRPALLPVLRDVLFFRAAGITRIIGAPWSADLRQCRSDPHSGALEFEAQRLARTLRPAMDVPLAADEFALQLTDPELASATTHLRALAGVTGTLSAAPMAIAAGAKVPLKDWGESNWAALIARLTTRNTGALVFVGAADEWALAERLAAHWPGPALNLCGRLTPRETAAVLGRCALLACHDSGPMHLAASQGTPCVALFGNLDRPRRWFPYGARHRVIYESSGVRNISVAQVLDAIDALRRETAPAS